MLNNYRLCYDLVGTDINRSFAIVGHMINFQ